MRRWFSSGLSPSGPVCRILTALLTFQNPQSGTNSGFGLGAQEISVGLGGIICGRDVAHCTLPSAVHDMSR